VLRLKIDIEVGGREYHAEVLDVDLKGEVRVGGRRLSVEVTKGEAVIDVDAPLHLVLRDLGEILARSTPLLELHNVARIPVVLKYRGFPVIKLYPSAGSRRNTRAARAPPRGNV